MDINCAPGLIKIEGWRLGSDEREHKKIRDAVLACIGLSSTRDLHT
jgi:hypothetical protein